MVVFPGRDSHRALVIAHRGASGHRPEHSEAAYRVAIELGADAVEPDLVASRDGVLLLRHENELSGSTDVASHPEFAARRTRRSVDGVERDGWFSEDFDWAELATLRAREPMPEVRPESARHDGRWPLMRLDDLVELLAGAPRPVGLVAELKHASHFAARGLLLDELAAPILARVPAESLVVESFEREVLLRIRARGLGGRIVYLLDETGTAPDLLAPGPLRHDALRTGAAPSYAEQLEPAGLAELAESVDGISVPLSRILDDASPSLVQRAHALGLDVFTWTLRAENRHLPPAYRRGDRPDELGDWRGCFRAVFASGVDGVFADHPELAVAARDGGDTAHGSSAVSC